MFDLPQNDRSDEATKIAEWLVSPDYTKFELAVKYVCESNNNNRRKKRGADGDYIIRFLLSFNLMKNMLISF